MASPGLQTRSKSEIKFLNVEINYTAAQAIGTDCFKGCQLYRVPFQFLVPEFISMGFARSWNQEEALKDWHALLPPSVNSSMQSNFWTHGSSNAGPGKIQYQISAAVFNATENHRLYCIGSERREIRLRSRPWQTSFLDNAPFVEAGVSRKQTLSKGLLYRSLGSLSTRPVEPHLGNHFIGRTVSENEIAFEGTCTMEIEFTSHRSGTGPPRLTSTRGEMRQTTSYRQEAITLADPLQGHQICHSSDIEIVQTKAEHWEVGSNPIALQSCDAQARSYHESRKTMVASQRLTLIWRWSTKGSFAPSFSTALMSRWFAIHVWITYMDLDSNTAKEIQCTFPAKLSVEPSCHSIDDKPLQTLPAYSAPIYTEESSESWLESSDTPPSYAVVSGDTPT
jgi:hypothetical protein